MKNSGAKSYQTYILFFSWVVGLLLVFVQLYFEAPLSQLMLIIVLLDIAVNFKKLNHRIDRYSRHAIVLILIFYSWLIFSNAYSPSPVYKFTKSVNFIADMVFFLYPFFIRKLNIRLFIRLYSIVLLPLALYFVYMKSILWSIHSPGTQFFMDIRGAYLGIGLHLGILFLLLLYFEKNIFLKIITLFLLIATSARGPLVFLIFVTLGYLLIKGKFTIPLPKHIMRSILLIGILFIVYIFNSDTINSLLSTAIQRFESLAEGGDISANSRLRMLEYAFYQPFENISTFLFGNGIGSFGILYERMDYRSYPHNLFLEVFFELGIIGLTILSLLLIAVVRVISLKNVFGLLFIYTFLNSMKSSSITDLWILFSTMGFIVALNAMQTQINESQSSLNPQ